MGNETCGRSPEETPFRNFKSKFISHINICVVHINNFKLTKIIGVGSYGKVWKAIYIKDNKIYAVKEMSKNLIDKLLLRKNVEMERKILGEISGM